MLNRRNKAWTGRKYVHKILDKKKYLIKRLLCKIHKELIKINNKETNR